MSVLTNAILSQHPGICGRAINPRDESQTVVAYTHVCLRGYVTRSNDPLYREPSPKDRGGNRISKLTRLEDLAATLIRWSLMGRVIDGSVPYTEPSW